MNIKINKENAITIQNEINKAHPQGGKYILTVGELLGVVSRSETEVYRLVGSVKNSIGAVVCYRTGKPVSNLYKYFRFGTMAEITRKKTGWFLTGVEKVEIGVKGGGMLIHLTKEQDEIAVKNFRSQYAVQKSMMKITTALPPVPPTITPLQAVLKGNGIEDGNPIKQEVTDNFNEGKESMKTDLDTLSPVAQKKFRRLSIVWN